MSAAAASRPAGVARALGLLAAWLAAVVAVTGATAPVLHAGLAAFGVHANFVELTLRLLEIVAIAGTFALLAALGGNDRRGWGLPRRGVAMRRLAWGLAIGVTTMVPICALLLLLGVRVARPELDADAAFWAGVVARAAAAAAVIALSEELWFRGGLFTACERLLGVGFAVAATSLLYALAHFLDAGGSGAAWTIDATAGFAVIASAFAGVWSVVHVDSMAALLAAGLLLAAARVRHGDVALCIGVHAGWVLSIKSFKKGTVIAPEAPLRFLAGHYDDLIGWLAAGVLAVGAVIVWRALAPRARPAQ